MLTEGELEVDLSAITRQPPCRPLVAILGRPNVGKSTLFNRLLKSRQAITDNHPGVTRDCLYAELEWNGRRFTLIDTGGFVPHSEDTLTVAVRMQAEKALEEADIAILVCDASTGLTDLDRELAALLRRPRQSCLLVINKADNAESDRIVDDFYKLGLGDPFPVSAATGRRTGDLLDLLMDYFPPEDKCGLQQHDNSVIRTVIVGRPNVGKSTLMNRLAGYQVSLVQAEPGTTRDATSIRILCRQREFLLMDTAGLRRRTRVDNPIEFYSSRRTDISISRADVAIVLLDALEGVVLQDARIIGQVLNAGCGLLLAVNKWDLLDSQGIEARKFAIDLQGRFPFISEYPMVFISALTGKRVGKCLQWVEEIQEQRKMRIPTSRLNSFLKDLTQGNPPVSGRQGLHLLYATQTAVSPPSFAIFINHLELIDNAYQRFVEKRLRDEFGFRGAPIRIFWRKRRRT